VVSQFWLQQSASEVQVPPGMEQPDGQHMPPTQLEAQHSASVVHAAPSTAQPGAAHVPLGP
jgi:hypothetical protein